MQYAMCVQLCVSLIARRLATSHETHLLHVTQGCGARNCKCSAVHRCFRRHCRVNRQYSDVHSGLHTMHVSLTFTMFVFVILPFWALRQGVGRSDPGGLLG